jgi:hypothetical protein
MSLIRSKLEAEGEASVVIGSTLEVESETVGSGRSETGNVVLVFELDCISGSE